MAERRMFAKTVINSDIFLDMPLSTQALYFHLSMRADDDGFINNPKKIQRMIGCGEDDLKLLIAKNFIIPFESGVVVIKHWKIHNYIRQDRHKSTLYTDEKSMLTTTADGRYTICQPSDNQTTYQRLTQVRLGKDRIDKDSIVCNIGQMSENNQPTTWKKRFSPPTVEEVSAYCTERHNNVDREKFVDYYTANGWKVGKNSMKCWKAAVRTWEKNNKGIPASRTKIKEDEEYDEINGHIF